MEDAQAADVDGADEFDDSVLAWEIAVKGKSAREIGNLHEAWAAAHVARGAIDKAQVSWWHPSRRQSSKFCSTRGIHSTHVFFRAIQCFLTRKNQTVARVATACLNDGATGHYSIS